MKRILSGWWVGIAATAVLLLMPGFGVSNAVAAGPTRVSGEGEAAAAEFVTYVGHDGVNRNVPSIATIGNRITFGFNATKGGNGNVRGQMQLVDHDLGLTIHSDVETLSVPHGTQRSRWLGGCQRSNEQFNSGGVIINGAAAPGWRLVNSPLFDAGEPGGGGATDTVCFELFNAAGLKVHQWSAFISSGNVQINP